MWSRHRLSRRPGSASPPVCDCRSPTYWSRALTANRRTSADDTRLDVASPHRPVFCAGQNAGRSTTATRRKRGTAERFEVPVQTPVAVRDTRRYG
jgi:hypothetical protein